MISPWKLSKQELTLAHGAWKSGRFPPFIFGEPALLKRIDLKGESMDLLHLIMERRSIRRFKPDPVPQKSLDSILEAVRWTPSWTNSQCWEVIIVNDASVKRQLEALLFKPNRASNGVLEAPIILALCGKMARSGYYRGEIITRWGDWVLFDCGLATQSLCLMSHALGLGTVIIGAFDHRSAEKLLAVPKGYAIVCLIPLGYPAVTPKTPRRKEIREFTHMRTFRT